MSYLDAVRQAKEAAIAAIAALPSGGVMTSATEPRFERLAEIACALRDMERDAAAVEAEHAVVALPSKHRSSEEDA